MRAGLRFLIRNFYIPVFFILVGALTLAFPMGNTSYGDAAKQNENSAVIFIYHRIGEDQYPNSNLGIEKFKEHIRELKKGEYNVLPIETIVDTLKKGDALPDKTVGLSFEGGYRSTLENAVPLLKDAELPFTIFLAVDRIDWNAPHYMNWDEIKSLRKHKLIDIGALPAAYQHMTQIDESTRRSIMNRAISRFREQFGTIPALFAYPFGEYNINIETMVKEYGFKGGLGQHSGVTHEASNFYSLPRFSMTSSYGGLDRFQLTANTLPLPVYDVLPEDSVISETSPQIGFTVDPSIGDLSKLSCFASEQGKINIERFDNRIEMRLPAETLQPRIRINCTIPVLSNEPGKAKRWRWFGMLFTTSLKET